MAMVTNDNKDKPLVIFETEDMVFVSNTEGQGSCGTTRKMSYWFDKTAKLQAYAAGRDGFSPKAQHLETSREMEMED